MESNPLAWAYARCPGLETYCASLWSNFSPRWAYPVMAQRTAAALEELPRAELEAEMDEWVRLGIVPEPDVAQPELIGRIWLSPLFQKLMSCIGFWPPADVDLREFIPTPYPRLHDLAIAHIHWRGRCQRGRLAEGKAAYWQEVLRIQAPLVYLETFLNQDGSALGCDLAAGWGRICLALPDYKNRQVEACDLSESSLELLRGLAARRGLDERTIRTHVADICNLPFPADHFDFLLAFDIFEHLDNDVLRRALTEALRCGKLGAVLYTEIPLHCYCPALTHVQNWDQFEVVRHFESVEWEGKRWKLVFWNQHIPDHFTFQIDREEPTVEP